MPYDEALYASWHPYFLSNAEAEERDAALAGKAIQPEAEADSDPEGEDENWRYLSNFGSMYGYM